MPPTVPAPIRLAPRVVVFDYGEVISRTPSPEDRAGLVTGAGVDDEAVDVDGARAVGGTGHAFTDAAALESWLRELAS